MAGVVPLREAIARKLARHYGRSASPEAEITVTCGGTEALACAIQALVQPGDEVAVIGTFRIKSQVKTADLSAAPEEIAREATLVLFPRVRVLDVGSLSSGGEATAGELILALPPQQAQVLIAAQAKARLTLALRRPGDEVSINRLDTGMVDETTFDKLLQGLQAFEMPPVPGVVTVVPAAKTEKK
jgi:Flp pilus assembly protein CpaB